jgi:hypothetical protein
MHHRRSAICDFALRLRHASSPGAYFFHGRGWLDLLGSIPSLGLLRITALLRLARLSRLERVIRKFRAEGGGGLTKDVLANRGQYAGFITLVISGGRNQGMQRRLSTVAKSQH